MNIKELCHHDDFVKRYENILFDAKHFTVYQPEEVPHLGRSRFVRNTLKVQTDSGEVNSAAGDV